MGNKSKLWPQATYHEGFLTSLCLFPFRLAGMLLGAIARFLVGLPMGERKTDAGWFTRAKSRLDRGERIGQWEGAPMALRGAVHTGSTAVVLGLAWAYAVAPGVVTFWFRVGLVVAVVVGARAAVRAWNSRHFRRDYANPLADTLREILGWPEGTPWRKFLHVSPELEGLAPIHHKEGEPSKFRQDVRYAYGQWVLRPLRYPIDRLWSWRSDRRAAKEATKSAARGVKSAAQWVKTATRATQVYFSRPIDEKPPRVEIKAAKKVFLTGPDKTAIGQRVTEKLGVGDLQFAWDQKGKHAKVTATKIKRPPAGVDFSRLLDLVNGELSESQFYVGDGPDGMYVSFDLDDDSPHIACSGGSGSGKTRLAAVIAMQVLLRGGRVVILDRKGSHTWAKGLPGVEYCTTQKEMHRALIKYAHIADARNTYVYENDEFPATQEQMRQALLNRAAIPENGLTVDEVDEMCAEGPLPTGRVLIVFEEMNATSQWLQTYWNKVRSSENNDPKKSPAIDAFQNIMFMGRSALVNIFAVAQMLSAKACGGPEARENFGVRFLARYTANAWKMLVPECAMPRKSKVRGRWQMAIAGEATEVQVAYENDEKTRRFAEHAATVGAQAATAAEGVAAVALLDRPHSDVEGRDATGSEEALPRHDSGDSGGDDFDAIVAGLELDAEWPDSVTISEAMKLGVLTGPSQRAIQQRILRAQKRHLSYAPKEVGTDPKKKNAKLYLVDELKAFNDAFHAEAEQTSTPED